MRSIQLIFIAFCGINLVDSLTPNERAINLVAKMTIDEKLILVGGLGLGQDYAGVTSSIPRLNVPSLHLQDGPQGVADGLKQVTFWPSTLAVVSTWDLNLMQRYAEAIGWEQKKKGVNIHLGPMVNIARVPTGGRNFESFGEDPHLSSKMVVPYINGIQSNGIIATVKHFVDNNQEKNRTITSANVPQRAQWEIYYPAFKAAVDAGVGSVMCSYNKINGSWACENAETIADLKGRMGFQGFVMSDWFATHSTVKAAIAGLDQEMPNNNHFGQNLKNAILSRQVPMSRLDDMAVRILTPCFAVGLMDSRPSGNKDANARNATHDRLANVLATTSIVLVKNSQNLLPLSNTTRRIVVIGDDAIKPQAGGSGSGGVVPPYVSTPLNAIQGRAKKSQVKFAASSDVATALKLAAASDVAIVFVGAKSSEGIDQKSLSLGDADNQLISEVAKVQKNIVVVTHTPNAVLMPWIDQVASVLVSTYPGQECGNAVASILFGDSNPSGKLPVTFPKTESQVPANKPINYPGIANEANYTEGIFVGYRWYDANSQVPLFPFGHGLSYTSFVYSNAKYNGNTNQIQVDVKNNGTRSGREVVQFYLGFQ